MAQQSTTTLVDDLDDTMPAQETVRFGVDGTSYEIDLSTTHAAALRADLALWVTHARRTSGRTHRSPTPTRNTANTGRTATPATAAPDPTPGRAVGNPEHTAAVRAWAQRNGYGVSDRGRIPTAVQQAFDTAH